MSVKVTYDTTPEARLRELIRMREKALHDEASLLEEAMEEGEARGRVEGRVERETEIATRMRADGVPEEIIKKYLS